MSESDERPKQEPSGADSTFESGALESAESYVARSPGTGESGDGSGAAFSASFAAFVEWAEANSLIRLEKEIPYFSRPRNGFGDEHEAWYDEATSRWFKATYPNRFGMAWGRDGSANAREYLSRLVLQNRYFNDDIRLIALVNCEQKLRVLTSQPHIAGGPAPAATIQAWFENLGFRRLVVGGRIVWHRQEENLLVADAHEGNVIITPSGTLVPIDLNIMEPSRDFLEKVLGLAAE